MMNNKALKRKRVINNKETVNKIIKLINYYGLNIVKIGRGGNYKTLNQYKLTHPELNLSNNIIIELKETRLELTTKYLENRPCTYIFSLNDQDLPDGSGLKMFMDLCKIYKMPKVDEYEWFDKARWYNEESGKYVCSAKPLVDYNKRYNEDDTLTNCYEYDLNSAYSSILLGKIPDLYKPYYEPDQIVKKGYIGFLINDDLTLVNPGMHSDVVFPLIDAPEGLKGYCNKYYNIKKNTKGKNKTNAKAQLNYPIGYAQRYNPFFRSYVVHKCNEIIKNLIDDNSLFWNTDAIFSKIKRDDLVIGNEIGNFKEELCKSIKYKGNTYQINDNIPVYRGIPKAWFEAFEKINGRPFDLLKDEIPHSMNHYKWNWDTLTLEVINYEKKINH